MRQLTMFAIALSVVTLTSCNQPSKKDEKKEREGAIGMTRHKTDSGLEYEIIKEGVGVSPKKGQRITVHYTGWLVDKDGKQGMKFDSSFDRDQPFTFAVGVGHVIQGWDEGLLAMKVGEKRRLIIPAGLGYGATGVGRIIPPHATLMFEVELLGVS